jgi:predicted HicB family RNase H-like nuclease
VGGVEKNVLHYKGYVAKVEFDEEANIFHGEVINLRDVITFEGESVAELRQELKESLEDYFEFCKERGEEPEKPFSGKFVVRIYPELHQRITLKAKSREMSLNQWITETLESAVN